METIAAYLIALGLALMMATGPARSADYTNDGPVGKSPRWSNGFQQQEGTVVTPGGCLLPSPEYQANYVPGVDAWGNPVIPAETIRPYSGPPVIGELDLNLRKMQVGAYHGDLIGKIPVPLPGTAWPPCAAAGGGCQDCVPPTK